MKLKSEHQFVLLVNIKHSFTECIDVTRQLNFESFMFLKWIQRCHLLATLINVFVDIFRLKQRNSVTFYSFFSFKMSKISNVNVLWYRNPPQCRKHYKNYRTWGKKHRQMLAHKRFNTFTLFMKRCCCSFPYTDILC